MVAQLGASTLSPGNVLVNHHVGMLCHGAGGMSAHHAFGARSWRAPALIGTGLVAVALLLGADLALVLRSFPLALLAALPLVAGITHVPLLGDLRARADWAIALSIGATGAAGHLLVAVVVGLLVAAVRGYLRRGAARSAEATCTAGAAITGSDGSSAGETRGPDGATPRGVDIRPS